MKLHIKDRIYIPQMFAQQNSFMEFNIKRAIISKIQITDTDKKDYEIVEDTEKGRITWNIDKDMNDPLDVEFTKEEIDYLKKSCELLTDNVYPDDFWIVVEKIYNA